MHMYASEPGRTRTSIRALAVAAFFLPVLAAAQYSQHNLVSDGFVTADHTDLSLINPWGMAFSATSPIWTANNGTSTSTLYDGNGVKQALTVTTLNAPTGTVFNSSSDFSVTNGSASGAARFLFADEGGHISGWSSGVSATTALMAVDHSGSGASYKGLAIQTGGTGSRLYAANFARGAVDMFDGSFNYIGSFTDTTVDAGFSPFNVQSIGGNLFVTYAQLGADGDEVAGAGLGFVDEVDRDGHLIKRIASHGALNAPWGLALAPSNFGLFSNDLLVGNFGDGTINAFDPVTGAQVGTLSDVNKTQIAIDGLWGLSFGNGAANSSSNSLYFTAGPGGEQHGLFGRLDVVPEPTSLAALAAGFAVLLKRRRR